MDNFITLETFSGEHSFEAASAIAKRIAMNYGVHTGIRRFEIDYNPEDANPEGYDYFDYNSDYDIFIKFKENIGWAVLIPAEFRIVKNDENSVEYFEKDINLSNLEEHSSFENAAGRARELAIRFCGVTGVKPSKDDFTWWVQVDIEVYKKIKGIHLSIYSSNIEITDYTKSDFESEARGDIYSEMMEDQENYSRSDSDGWFYD